MISHSVGVSSSTGAKLPESTCQGLRAGFSGGSMKLLIKSSRTLKIAAGSADGICYAAVKVEALSGFS